MTPRWLLRMSHLARHPPSAKRVKLVLAVLALCALVVAVEWLIGWPEALVLEGPMRGPGR